MSLTKGIRVQQSRFAALKIESDSDSGEEDEWQAVGSTKKKGKASPPEHHRGPDGSKLMSKSAKKRARKKRNQSASSESADGGGRGDNGKESEGHGVWQKWQQKDEEAMDQEFQKDLEQAILRSKLDAEQQAEIAKERKAAQILAKSIKSKKGVTLSLQELHRGIDKVQATPEAESPKESPSDQLFFEKVEEEVKSEIGRERSYMNERRRLPSSESLQSPTAEETPRIAHLMDELEKRDKAIAELIKRNKELKVSLKEVKGRNQSLCRIMSHGEFSTKADLIQQNEDLSSMKNELTEEITSLRTALEQERTKNKALRTELAKLQGAKGTGSSKSTNH